MTFPPSLHSSDYTIVKTEKRGMVKSYTFGWYRGYFQFGVAVGVKQPGREADHSPTSRADVKNDVELYLHFPTLLNCGYGGKFTFESTLA
jgi:hypothetical protein